MYSDLKIAKLPPKLPERGILTKPGVRGYPGLDDAQALLLGVLLNPPVDLGEHILDLTAQNGAVALYLTEPQITLAERSRAALEVLQRQFMDDPRVTVQAALPLEMTGEFDTVLAVLPADKGNEAVREYLQAAFARTKPGGLCLIAGDKDKGFERYFKWFKAAFGEGEVLERHKGMRVAGFIKENAEAQIEAARTHQYTFEGLQITSLPGVFSAGKVDDASQLLLSHLPSPAGKQVLDIGAGAGVLGLRCAQLGAEVTLLEEDLAAVRSIEINARDAGLKVTALHSDVGSALPEQAQFDLVVMNPPFHVGTDVILEVAEEFIRVAYQHVRAGGEVWVVANQFLPYEPLMQKHGKVQLVIKNKSYKVLRGIRERN
ncbi:class I SAM-dependent methyltransferase [Deinococcus cellulosilyticus]|nr:class I SAM-dependent methyltransferase [Deinococcus cellulosilyticus]